MAYIDYLNYCESKKQKIKDLEQQILDLNKQILCASRPPIGAIIQFLTDLLQCKVIPDMKIEFWKVCDWNHRDLQYSLPHTLIKLNIELDTCHSDLKLTCCEYIFFNMDNHTITFFNQSDHSVFDINIIDKLSEWGDIRIKSAYVDE